MILKFHSDASYLTEPQARSRQGGWFYLGNDPSKPEVPNGPILADTGVIKMVLSSAAESEIGALFANSKKAVLLRHALQEMGHPQQPTPAMVDNTTAAGMATDSIKQQRSRAIDMRFFWLKDRDAQRQFNYYWRPGKINKADYFTKHHPPSHHRAMRPHYLHSPELCALAAALLPTMVHCGGVLNPSLPGCKTRSPGCSNPAHHSRQAAEQARRILRTDATRT